MCNNVIGLIFLIVNDYDFQVALHRLIELQYFSRIRVNIRICNTEEYWVSIIPFSRNYKITKCNGMVKAKWYN